jgi:hypothetical protein
MRNLEDVVPWSIAAVKVPRFFSARLALSLVWTVLAGAAIVVEECRTKED